MNKPPLLKLAFFRHRGTGAGKHGPAALLSSPAERLRRQTLLALVAATAVLGVVAGLAVRADTPTDYFVYYLAGVRLAAGASPYMVPLTAWDALAQAQGVRHFTSPYRYPPYTAALVRLLLPLGPGDSLLTWEIASVLAAVAGAWIIGRALGGGWRIWVAAAAIVCFGPVYHTLLDGQVNAFVFLALAVAFWGLVNRRDVPLGLGIAVGAALKLTPLALLLLLVWRRRWRAVGIALGGLALLTVAVLPVSGTAVFRDYAANAVALTAPLRVVVSPQNQSFTGVLGRLLLDRTTSVQTPAVRSTRTAALAFAAALAVASAVALWPVRRRRGRPGDGRERPPSRPPDASLPPRYLPEAWAFSAIVAATLLVGPFTWYHQFIFLLVPLLLAVEQLVAGRHWRVLALVGAVVVLVNLNETLYVVALGWIHTTGVWRALSFPFLLALGLWAYSCVRVRRLQ